MQDLARGGVVLALFLALCAPGIGAQSSISRSSNQPSSLSVTSNAPGAQILINGEFKGNAPATINLNRGTYNIIVSAPGYQNFSAQVVVNGPTVVNAILVSMLFPLNVSTNVQGAQILVDGAPYQASGYAPGNHTVSVSAQGYQTATTQVAITQPTNVNVMLTPSNAILRFTLAPNLLDPNQDPNAAVNNIAIFIDGQRVGPGDLPVPPGNHAIRFTSGGLSVTGNYSFNPGQVYLIQPQLGISVGNQ